MRLTRNLVLAAFATASLLASQPAANARIGVVMLHADQHVCHGCAV